MTKQLTIEEAKQYAILKAQELVALYPNLRSVEKIIDQAIIDGNLSDNKDLNLAVWGRLNRIGSRFGWSS